MAYYSKTIVTTKAFTGLLRIKEELNRARNQEIPTVDALLTYLGEALDGVEVDEDGNVALQLVDAAREALIRLAEGEEVAGD